MIFLCNNCFAQDTMKDTLDVSMEKNVFVQGDSIAFEIKLKNYRKSAKTATVQLWIEEIKTGKNWKFRYPLINGYLYAKLKIDNGISNGVYAFNFLLQKTFFSLNGNVKNANKKDTRLSYVIISKSRQTMMDAVDLNNDKSFTLHNLLFQDSAFVVFSRPKQKKNDLLIDIATPLDSAFTPSVINTQLVTIGDTAALQKITQPYTFKPDVTKYKIILPEVIITNKSKRLEDFDKENSTGMFTGADAIVLDGLNSTEIANAPDLFTFLSIKVGGLRLDTDNESGVRSFTWRGQPTDIYLNEIRMDPDVPFWINPSDIAMIKIFRPGTTLSAEGSPGGAIAIYTKTAEYLGDTNRRYSFFILGYTGGAGTWK